LEGESLGVEESGQRTSRAVGKKTPASVNEDIPRVKRKRHTRVDQLDWDSLPHIAPSMLRMDGDL